MGSQLASFTLRPDIAQAFANLATYRKVPKDKLKVVEMDLTPEHIWMIGHPSERELVVDYGQGYMADKVVEYKPEAKYSLRKAGEPVTKGNVLAAMTQAQEIQPYINCQLCVQMATGVSKILDLPKVKEAKAGDVYTFGERKNMASHYAVALGDGNIAEVEEWGENVRQVPLSDVINEYGEPDSIRRPPDTAYTGTKYSLGKPPASHPMLMYHATFSDFTVPKTNHGDKEYKQWGFHVGSAEAAENRLGIKENEDAREGVRSGNAGANIMPVYIQAKNPLRLNENRTGRWGVDDIMNAVMEKAEKSGIEGISDEDISDFYNDKFDIDEWLNVGEKPTETARSWSDVNEWSAGERSDALKDFLNRLGYDSIVYKNDYEGGGDSYILFKPNQIKSAISNTGAYGKSPDIRYSLGTYFPTAEEAEKAEIGRAHV